MSLLLFFNQSETILHGQVNFTESDLLNGIGKGRAAGGSSLSEEEVLTANISSFVNLVGICQEAEVLGAQIKGRHDLNAHLSEAEVLEGLIHELILLAYYACGTQYKIVHENPKAFTVTRIEN